MDSNFTNEDFEDFLKRSADGMRMRPSTKVWEGIENRLQKRRRRVIFATSAFVLLSSFLGYFLIDNSKDISSTIATLPSEVKETNGQSQSPSGHSLSSTSATEAKVIDIQTKKPVAISGELRSKEINKKQLYLSKKPTPSTLPVEQAEDGLAADSSTFTPTIIDSDPIATEVIQQEPLSQSNNDSSDRVLSIESVTNAYKPMLKKAKVSFQVFFTPTVSYRKLSENKSYLRSIPQPNLISSAPMEEDVNDAVTHKPDIGLELGMAAKYPIAKNLNLRAGLQFNINRYDIKAFKHSRERATIALNTGNNGIDVVNTVTDYRNYNGYRSDWLQNFYFQVSVPVGAEIRLYSNRNTHFGIAGTIQPTYLLGERAYLLSSDYKNYSEVPWLTRHWNVNTAIETFVSYSTGKMQWQVGPQVRYQLLSSFVTKYPLKENLFDFGFKIGVSINKNKSEQPE
jgi:hypothetical protein